MLPISRYGIAMREYDGSGSSPSSTIWSCGACLRMVSAAMTPAGPLPMMRCFMNWFPTVAGSVSAGAAIRRPRRHASQAETASGLFRQLAFRRPATDAVVLGQHLVETVDKALRGAGLGR